MKLINPIEVREKIMIRHGWYRIEEIAEHLKLSSNTTSRALRGEPVRIITVQKLAEAIGEKASEIATIVHKEK